MKESDFQTQFSKYNSVKKMHGAFELKDSLGKKSISYKEFTREEQQLPSLLACQKEGIRYKISDADPRLKPCDYISTPPMPGYIAIKFPVNKCYIIPVENFIFHRDRNKKSKSITQAECERICVREVKLL